MYVAVKGGEKAIAEAHRLLAEERRGDVSVPELSLSQIKNQMRLAVARIMSEGSLYSEDLADIYQDIRDFIFVFQLGLNETMNDSLAACQEHFALYWGQKLVNTLRALHDVKYNQPDEEEENEEAEEDE